MSVGEIKHKGDFNQLLKHIRVKYSELGFEVTFTSESRATLKSPNYFFKTSGIIHLFLYKNYKDNTIKYSFYNTGLSPIVTGLIALVLSPFCAINIYRDSSLSNTITSSIPLIVSIVVTIILRYINARNLKNIIHKNILPPEKNSD